METKRAAMKLNETRILKTPANRLGYAIISMPKTAWYWLDDLVEKEFPVGGYKALVQAFKEAETPEALSSDLRKMAREHCETQMASLYHLANDNKPAKGYNDTDIVPALPGKNTATRADIARRLPTVYRLFHFLPHATTLTSVWERRNYHLRDLLW